MIRKILGVLLLLFLAVAGFSLYVRAQTPQHLWYLAKEFQACPARPSCVSSRATDEVHAIEPLRYEGGRAGMEAAMALLQQVVAGTPGAHVVHGEYGYLHAVYETPRMRFRDDLELLAAPDGRIEVRSVSRFGYRDRGVNRARVEDLRARYAAAVAAATPAPEPAPVARPVAEPQPAEPAAVEPAAAPAEPVRTGPPS